MDPLTLTLLTTTVDDPTQAQMLAQGAVQAGLAACAQVEAITSHYLWQGRLEHSAEWRVVFKTLPLAENALLEWVRARHPYEVPQLLTRQERAQPDYARWVAAQVRLPA